MDAVEHFVVAADFIGCAHICFDSDCDGLLDGLVVIVNRRNVQRGLVRGCLQRAYEACSGSLVRFEKVS